MKRFLKWMGLLLLTLVVGVVAAFLIMFAGRKPVEDGEVLPGGVVTIKDGMTTVYLLEAGDGTAVLVDAGMDETGAPIIAALQKKGLGSDKVKAILLTHGHRDHIGALRQFPAAQVYGLVQDESLVEGSVSSASPLLKIVAMVSKPKPTGLRVTRRVADGETLTLGKLTVRVFAVPGHTGGSAAYLIGRTLFLGDSADASRGGDLKGASWAFSENTAQNAAALKALATKLQPMAADISSLAFAHSGPLTSMAPLTDFAARHQP